MRGSKALEYKWIIKRENRLNSQIEASTRFELVHDGFADRSLTAWVRRLKKPPVLRHLEKLNAQDAGGC